MNLSQGSFKAINSAKNWLCCKMQSILQLTLLPEPRAGNPCVNSLGEGYLPRRGGLQRQTEKQGRSIAQTTNNTVKSDLDLCPAHYSTNTPSMFGRTMHLGGETEDNAGPLLLEGMDEVIQPSSLTEQMGTSRRNRVQAYWIQHNALELSYDKHF